MENVYGIFALILGTIGAAAYIRDTYHKRTLPHRFAWLIFLILSVVSFASQAALGAQASLFYAGWFVVNNIIIVGLSFRKNGGHGEISKINIFCLMLAIVGIVLWKTLSSPLLALISVLIADGIGAIMIVLKSYKYPQSETLIMWVLGIVASGLSALSVGKLDIVLLASPIQLLFFNIAIVVAILLGNQFNKRVKLQSELLK